MTDHSGFMGMIDYAISRAIGECVMDAIFRIPSANKFEKQLQNGTTLYRKKKNTFVRSHNYIHFNRRLQTKRVMTHTKK